jgi:hypothetical protein
VSVAVVVMGRSPCISMHVVGAIVAARDVSGGRGFAAQSERRRCGRLREEDRQRRVDFVSVAVCVFIVGRSRCISVHVVGAIVAARGVAIVRVTCFLFVRRWRQCPCVGGGRGFAAESE